MAHITADRVRDTTTTTGTGALTVSGSAPNGYRTFSDVASTSDTFYYAIQHQAASEWEVGLGTYSAANQITRTTIYSSSNSGSAVNFSAGTKDIFITLAASRTVQRDNAGNISGLVVGTDVQAYDADLSAIASLSGATGLLKKTAADTWTLDTGSYLTGESPTLTTPRIAGSSTGYTSLASSNNSATNYTVTFPAETMTVGFRNIPAVGTKTSSYTLALNDVGKYVQVGSGGSITIPDATFAEGDVISVFNNTSGTINITCSITTAYIAGTDADTATMTLATRGVATIMFISSTVCVVSGNVT